jgi:phage repressor protein C with HTH and peptisase S24 domain
MLFLVSTQGERLQKARDRAGFKTPADAIKRFHWTPSTYRAHENGQNGFPPKAALKYSKAYAVPAGWLLTGEGTIDDLEGASAASEFYSGRLPGAAPEVDVEGGLGRGRIGQATTVQVGPAGDTYYAHQVMAEWVFPPEFLRHELRATPSRMWVLKVDGDSMGDTLRPGDRVLVDLNHVKPYPNDSIFVIDDGGGPSVKRLHVVRGSDPPMIDIISDNPVVPKDRVLAEDLRIIGRVCGRVSRM